MVIIKGKYWSIDSFIKNKLRVKFADNSPEFAILLIDNFISFQFFFKRIIKLLIDSQTLEKLNEA